MTAAISLVLIVLGYDEVYSSLVYLHRVWKHGRSWRLLWSCFWARRSPAAELGAFGTRG